MDSSDQLQALLRSAEIAPLFNEEILHYLSLYHFEKGELICSQGKLLSSYIFLSKGR